jgi:hypothetical protein
MVTERQLEKIRIQAPDIRHAHTPDVVLVARRVRRVLKRMQGEVE